MYFGASEQDVGVGVDVSLDALAPQRREHHEVGAGWLRHSVGLAAHDRDALRQHAGQEAAQRGLDVGLAGRDGDGRSLVRESALAGVVMEIGYRSARR